MLVRIRISRGPRAQTVLPALAGFFTLAAVVCFILAVWKICSDLGWAGAFFIAYGALSHWQVWVAGGVLAQLVSFRLGRRRTAGHS